MHNTGKKKAERAMREARRLAEQIECLRRENAALLKRAQAAETGSRKQALGFHNILVRVALTYGEDSVDESRRKSIGKHLILPPMNTAGYEVHSRKDETGNAVIGVGLADDPDDNVGDAR